MTIEEALVGHLKGLASVSALVGARVYPNRAPQSTGAFPRVILWNTSRRDVQTVDAGPGLLPTATLRIECQGHTYGSAAGVAATVRAKPSDGGVNGFRGQMGGASGVFVQACFVTETAQDDEVSPVDSSETPVHICALEVSVTFEGA